MLRPKTCLKEVIPEERNRQRASRAQTTWAFKQQVFDVTPPVFSVCVSTRGGPKIRTQGENTCDQDNIASIRDERLDQHLSRASTGLRLAASQQDLLAVPLSVWTSPLVAGAGDGSVVKAVHSTLAGHVLALVLPSPCRKVLVVRPTAMSTHGHPHGHALERRLQAAAVQ